MMEPWGARVCSPRGISADAGTRRSGRFHGMLSCLPELLPPRLEGRRAAVKALLLDQRVIAGVGNIYASEALFRAGVRPARPAASLSRKRRRRLAGAVREVLEEAVARGGTTLRDFSGVDGSAGMFRLELAVYGREGSPCRRCGGPVRRAVLAGRSTFWCPRCQR